MPAGAAAGFKTSLLLNRNPQVNEQVAVYGVLGGAGVVLGTVAALGLPFSVPLIEPPGIGAPPGYAAPPVTLRSYCCASPCGEVPP